VKELEIIRLIRCRFPAVAPLLRGIGDDAAVIDWPGGRPVVVSTDLLVEGTHFRPADAPRDLGWKALAVSVSDLAAMGCRATAGVLAVALRRGLPEDWVEELIAGAGELCGRTGLVLAGGDTTETSGPVTLCSTVLGSPPAGVAPVGRDGAVPGQAVLVSGSLGGSLGGRHLRFPPRQEEALELVARTRPGAMIDLSDGLSSDARHLAAESGVRIRLHAGRIPVSAAAGEGDAGLRRALNDGEDFELLFTLDPGDAAEMERSGLAGTPVRIVGEVLEGSPGVTLVRPDGTEEPLLPGGYEHFRD
jgi:thiamine-monophosphate kinase